MSGVGIVVIIHIFVITPWVVSGVGIVVVVDILVRPWVVRCLASGIGVVIVAIFAIVPLRQQHFSSMHI